MCFGCACGMPIYTCVYTYFVNLMLSYKVKSQYQKYDQAPFSKIFMSMNLWLAIKKKFIILSSIRKPAFPHKIWFWFFFINFFGSEDSVGTVVQLVDL